jgi:hypothetical protein
MDNTKDMLEKIFTAQVLEMAANTKHRKQQGILTSTSDFISETVQEIRRKQPEIVRLLQQQK